MKPGLDFAAYYSNPSMADPGAGAAPGTSKTVNAGLA